MNFHFAEKDAATQHFDSLIKNQVVSVVVSVCTFYALTEYPP